MTAVAPHRRRGRHHAGGVVVAASIAALAALLLGGVAPASADTAPQDPGTPSTVGAKSLPTTQIDGVAWAQVVVGDTVFVGGSFSSARPAGAAPGVEETPRSNLLAYRLSTGELIPEFAPQLNGEVRSLELSPDGSTLYAVGTFTAVGEANRYRLAMFDTSSYRLQTQFQPTINGRVNDIVVTEDRIFIAGHFTSTNKTARAGLASYDRATGRLLPWAPQAVGGRVVSLVASPTRDKVVLAGNFTSINRSAFTAGMAAVDADAGRTLSWQAGRLIRNSGSQALITDLAGDDGAVYGTATSYGARSALEGAFRLDWNDGRVLWIADCHGDAYSITPFEGAAYVAGHTYYCGNIGGMPKTSPINYRRGVAFSEDATRVAAADPHGYLNVAGQPAPTPLSWYPDMNQGTYTKLNQGSWTVEAGSDFVVYGGEFTKVNGEPQQGLARFTRASTPGSALSPERSRGFFKPTVTPRWGGGVEVRWQANVDNDSEMLTYEVIRDGRTNQPVHRTALSSTFWNRPDVSFVDADVTSGDHSYRLRVTDPDGNTVMGDTVTVRVP